MNKSYTLSCIWVHGDNRERFYNDSEICFAMAEALIDKYYGCGIFLNGKCIHEGYLGSEKCQEYEKEFGVQSLITI